MGILAAFTVAKFVIAVLPLICGKFFSKCTRLLSSLKGLTRLF